MSLQVRPEIENAVRQRAAADGLSVDDQLARTFSSNGLIAKPEVNPRKQVETLLASWQANDYAPTLPPISAQSGETETEVIFRRWEEEDSSMTDEEVEAEVQSWSEFQQGMDETGTDLGMRRLF